ncbi:sensor domain-containing diguanylate cyclase [Photobacterium nomapromontoriensis]|uniref:sensor domain-containing diguanylate cyclase n=1 Tax=Photobacterium nomapromontoriensis TaxID=2910237 RepID=UPI003D0B44B8
MIESLITDRLNRNAYFVVQSSRNKDDYFVIKNAAISDQLTFATHYGVVIHRDFKPLYANDDYARCFGYQNAQEILALPTLLPLIAENEQQTARNAYIRVMSRQEPPGVRRYTNIDKQGNELNVMTVDNIVDWQGVPAMQIIVIDFSAQVAMQRKLQASEERYRELVDGSIQGILVHKNFRPLFCNQAYAHMLGFADSQSLLAQSSILPYIASKFQQQALSDQQSLLDGQQSVIKTEAKGIRRDKSPVWFSLLSRPVQWDGEQVVQVTAMDITEQHYLRQQLEYRANFDGLTNLLNRRALGEHFELRVIDAQTHLTPLSCLLIDIDNFKSINDHFGHQVGDIVLKQFAVSCKCIARKMDIIGRWGGEEFVLVLPRTRLAQAKQIASRLCRNIERLRISIGTERLHFSVSIGVATLTDATNSVDTMLLNADNALYEAKRQGKCCVVTAV